MGEFTEKTKGAANEAIGNVKQESDKPETRAEGKMQEEKGELQEEKGELQKEEREVKGALGKDV